MYHVVMGIATDDAQSRAKAEVVADLPGESVSATIVHADDDAELLSIPSISDVHDYLIDHGVEVSLLATDGTRFSTLPSVRMRISSVLADDTACPPEKCRFESALKRSFSTPIDRC